MPAARLSSRAELVELVAATVAAPANRSSTKTRIAIRPGVGARARGRLTRTLFNAGAQASGNVAVANVAATNGAVANVAIADSGALAEEGQQRTRLRHEALSSACTSLLAVYTVD